MESRKPPIAMECRRQARTEYLGIKVTPDEKAELVAACGGWGELSRYCRDSLFIGHSFKQTQARLKATLV